MRDDREQAAAILERQLELENPTLSAELRQSLAKLGAGIAVKTAKAVQEQDAAGPKSSGKKPAKPPKKAQVLRLPIWPEPARGTPNPILRSALFAAVQGKDCIYLERQLLACQKGLQIRFTGKQLNQSDLDVWEQALHLAREHPLGTRCEFSAHGFLKALGRHTGKSQHEQLAGAFARLMGCGVELTDRQAQMTYGGSLLEFYRDEKNGRYVIEFNPKILAFYDEGWTAVDWQQRQELRGKPLALWLHGYYSSHAKPYPVKVETLLALSGSNNKAKRDFKRRLAQALDELQTIGFITSYAFEGDTVTVEKPPTPSQQRFLDRQ